MADEEEPGQTAVAEAPIPDEAAEPPAELEQAAPEDQGEAVSGAPQEDEEAGQEEEPLSRTEAFAVAKAALKESDPEGYAELFPGEDAPSTPEDREQALSQREAQLDADARKTQRLEGLRAPLARVSAYSGDNLRQRMASALYPHVKAVEEGAKAAAAKLTNDADERQEMVEAVRVDYNTLFANALSVAEQAGMASGSWNDHASWLSATNVFENSEVYRHLSKEERGEVDALASKPQHERIGGLVWIGIQAGMRAAPDDYKAKTRKEIETELGAGEAMDKVLSAMGSGKSATNGSAATSQRDPTTLDKINEALMDSATPVDKLPGLQVKRNKLLGR